MWQVFTEHARKAVFVAQQEAARLQENFVSTEHLLLGVLHDRNDTASRIVVAIGAPVSEVVAELNRHIPLGTGRGSQDMQLTSESKRAIDRAFDESRRAGNNYIGTEHLLLGLIREESSIASQTLAKFGITLERGREEFALMLSDDSGGTDGRIEPYPGGPLPMTHSIERRDAATDENTKNQAKRATKRTLWQRLVGRYRK